MKVLLTILTSKWTWIGVAVVVVIMLAIAGINAALNTDGVDPLVEQAESGNAASNIPDYAKEPMIDLSDGSETMTTCGEMTIEGSGYTTARCQGNEFFIQTDVSEFRFGYTLDPFLWWWIDSTGSNSCTATSPNVVNCGDFQVVHAQ